MSGPGNSPATARDDGGFTLIELIVAMGIFTILLAIFTTSVASFSRTTVRTVVTSNENSDARTVMDLFDHGVRSSSGINRPGLVAGTRWYVEYRIDALTPSTCTQWVLRTDTHELARRTWVTGVASPTPSAWVTVATDVVNTAAQKPFVFAPADNTSQRQRLTINLNFQRETGPILPSTGLFAARNTSTLTDSNPDVDGDGQSDVPVCNDITNWRP